jgi:hypothetical protein
MLLVLISWFLARFLCSPFDRWACKSEKDSVFKAINKFFLAMTGAGLKAGE